MSTIDINKLRTACRNAKGRRIYQFFLDEKTGEITDITSSMDYVKVTRCEDCRSWKENECNLPEHGWCESLQMLTHAGDYCAWSPNLYDEEDNETD